MTRYGKSAEDFNRESAALEAAMKARRGVAAAEGELSGALEGSTQALDRATQATRLNRQAREEQASFSRRAAEAETAEARAVNVSTEAIQRNAAARERAALASRNLGGAFAGARDPLFGQAHGMADPTTGVSQYELRRQLQIGSQRAAQLQQAIGLGIQPGNQQGAASAATRAEAAALAKAQADTDYVQATRQKQAAMRRGDVEATAAAEAAREEAAARRKSTAAELESARTAEATARTTRPVAAGPGQELIRHPELYGRQAYAPIGREQIAGRPGAVAEYPMRFGGGNEAYDALVSQARAAEKAKAEMQGLAAAQNEEARQARLALNAHTERAMGQQAAATERATRATRFSSVELGTASQQMMRHGALTSEFIQAAARGETTLRELGNQAVITAGKFSAWTLAATAIYGAVAALNKVREGAVDTGTGISQLERFIPHVDRAQAAQGYRDTARDVNVPVKDVADAQAQFARIYHNQADSLQAARAALLATKLDNISTADSFNYLTAGARGFNLHAKDMVPLLAQINAGQNILGARVAETIPAFGKSAAAIKNAGGDLNEFLAIIFTMQRATGISGANISTVLSRSATNFIHKPQNEADLRQFGLNPDESYTKLVIDAVRKAQDMTPDQRRRLAAALGGPQLGSRGFVGLLTRPDILQQALGALGDPQANQRLLEHERRKVVESPQQQIAAIGVNLTRLGSALSQSGLTAGPMLLLKTLNGVLDLSVHLVEIWDKLPTPLKDALSVAGELYLVMRLIQRFGGSVPLLGAMAPDRRDASLIMRGSREAVSAAQDERERVARQYNRATYAASRGRLQLDQFDADYRARDARGELGGPDSEERARLNQRRLAMEAQVLRQEERAAELEFETNAAREEVLAAERTQAELKAAQAAQGARGVVAYGRNEGLFQPQENIYPSSRGAAGAGAGLPEREAIGAATGLPMVIPAGVTDAEANALRQTGGAVERTSGALGRLGASGRVLGRTVETGASVARGAGNAVRGMADRVGRLWTSLAQFQAGPLDALLLALGGYEVVKGMIDDAEKQASDTINRLDKKDPAVNQDAVRKAQSGGIHPLQFYQDLFGSVVGRETPHQQAQGVAEAQQRELDTLQRIRAQHPGQFMDIGAIQKDVQGNLANAQGSRDKIAALQDGISKVTHSYQMVLGNQQARAQAQALRNRLQSQLETVQAGGGGLQQEWAGLDPKAFGQRVKQDTDAITAYSNVFGSLRGSMGMRDLRAAYAVAVRQAKAHPTAGNLQELSAISQAMQQIGQQITSRFDEDLKLANTAQERADALERALAKVRQLPRGRQRTLVRQQIEQAAYAADQQARQTAEAYQQSFTTDRSQQDAIAIRFAAANVREAAAKFGRNSDQYKQAMTALNNARHQAATDAQQDVQGEVDSMNALLTARASGDPTGRAEATAAVTVAKNSLQAVLRDRTLTGRARANAVRNAQAGVITAQLALNNYFADQAAQLTQARFALRESQTTDPVKRAEIEAQAAKAAIASAHGQAAKLQAQATYNDKRNALIAARIQSSEDNIDFDLQMGKITNDQAAAQYQALLKNHNLTKQMRRDIQLKIHQLQQEADQQSQSFDLAVGAGIKLPTIYDVRRAIGSIRQAGDAGSRVVANNNINVSVAVNDPNAAHKVYDEIDRAMGTTIQSNLRQAGITY